ncbi:MAG: hypothetical protein JWO78_635, partial [Micavibrio sp.]|nr:hypothetical protein [Micavibrio sp.]
MLLSIARKAVTEEDAAKILADTFAIPRPFGVPTLVLRQENLPDKMTVEKNTSKRTALLRALNPFVKFYSDAELPADAEGTLLRILFKRALEQHGMDAHATDTLDRILSRQKSLCKFLKTGLASNFNALCLPYPHRKFPSHAHHYAKDYKEPLFSIVIAPRSTADGQKMMKEICGNLAQPRNPLPGYASQWQTFILWHEYAHGCGADETQADTMAAIICRKAFADQRFMTAWADIRAFDVIQKSADE